MRCLLCYQILNWQFWQRKAIGKDNSSQQGAILKCEGLILNLIQLKYIQYSSIIFRFFTLLAIILV